MLKYNDNTSELLCRALLGMKTAEECRSFLEDICTIQEIEAMAQRLDVARYLRQGMSYSRVNQLTGASTATICRVGKCVNYGSGGFKLAIDRLEEAEADDR